MRAPSLARVRSALSVAYNTSHPKVGADQLDPTRVAAAEILLDELIREVEMKRKVGREQEANVGSNGREW